MIVDINCVKCPFAVDREYGHDRLYCSNLDRMVKGRHRSSIDCQKALVAALPEKLQTSVSA